MKTYTHKQETWNKSECERRARYAPADAWGNKPPKGIIAQSASSYPQYGQTVRFNGGRAFDGEWYQAESVPLPKIHPSFEFVNLISWGTVIRRKS